MEKKMIEALTATGTNVMITMSADDLRAFASDIAQSVANQMASQTVDAIKNAMGDTMKFCTTEEAIRDYKIKLPTLNSWIAKGYVVPRKKGRKNIFLREDLVRLTQKKIG